METAKPISAPEMAGHVRRMTNVGFGLEIADPPQGATFELVAPATGQRFRVTVEEAPSWTDRMDAELACCRPMEAGQ